MELFLDILYIYIAVYSVYFLALAIRNLKDRPFKIEKRYSQYEDKDNLAVIIYSHNNKATLEALIGQLKQQNYPKECFDVFVILDNCTDGSEIIFNKDRFANVINFKDRGTLGKDHAVSLLLEQLAKEEKITSYVFIDGNRSVSTDFLTTVNSALIKNSVLSGETLMLTDNLDIIDSIKAVYQKYHMNFIRQARSLFGLAAQADSGVFIIKKQIVDEIGAVDFKDINSELKYSLLLSKISCRCTYNPNIKTFVNSEEYIFRRPRLSERLRLFVRCLKELKTKNFVFIEHVISLINPNFWLLLIAYVSIIGFSYDYSFIVDCKVVIFTFMLLIAGFCMSLINSKLDKKEIGLLMLYPLYSVCHIIKNFPPVRMLIAKFGRNSAKPDNEKLTIDVVLSTGHSDVPCKIEFFTEKELYKMRFLFKNKKYTTSGYLRMIDALQELKSKLDEYGFVLKICSCCSYFAPYVDGSTNMLKGYCNCDYPSPSIKEPKTTLIWNSCPKFSPAKMNNIIQEMVARGQENN